MKKKEFTIYFYAGILVLAVLLIVYLLNLRTTGFAVFQQNSQSEFDQGIYNNTFYNGSAIVLNLTEGFLSGSYTSKTFDASGNSIWSNLTWQGETPTNTSLSFKVRACQLPDCSDSNFLDITSENGTIDLNILNLSGVYFQYKIYFEGYNLTSNETNTSQTVSPFVSTVEIKYSLIPNITTSITISQPSGTKTSRTGIPINYNVVGQNLNCWYNVENSSSVIISNTTLTSCTNSTFDMPQTSENGDYIFNLYANGTSGFYKADSTFTLSVEIPQEEEQQINETVENVTTETNQTEQPQEQQPEQESITEIVASNLPLLTINQGVSQNLILKVKNTGTNKVSSCSLTAQEQFSSWISVLENLKDINSGEEIQFSFKVSAPENASEGERKIILFVSCSETSTSSELSVNVVKKKLDIDIIDAQRIRSNRVRVIYVLKELVGVDQNVNLKFSLIKDGSEVSNVSENRNISANSLKEFRINIPINETIEGNLTLVANLNSEVYSASIQEQISLRAPIGGFTIFEGFGTGGIMLLIGIASILIVILSIVRRLRKSKPNK